ncbi:MAG: 2OG-Fe(II) oxygenase [Planctomycetes bacterium]|nr:2OG-Fe(II) oxygenase [Planctomycetota bacterium]
MQLFGDDRYQALADRHKQAYAQADPFPHTVLDDFLPAEFCEKLLAEFPTPGQADWLRFERHHSRKLATREDSQLGDFTRAVLTQFNSAACLRFLEALTGITGLIPDPYFEGGGLHQIEPGGFLKIHTDFNFHQRLRLDRRINLIVYLNKDWREEYKGHLELWDRTVSRCVRKVLPVYNRCVVFSTTDWSYHGHPEKLACPPGWSRKSLALYYYSNGRPAEEQSEAHGTMWQERPADGAVRRFCAGVLCGVASVVETPARLLRHMATSLSSRSAA